jgi:hypothetical protein
MIPCRFDSVLHKSLLGRSLAVVQVRRPEVDETVSLQDLVSCLHNFSPCCRNLNEETRYTLKDAREL